MRTWTQRFRCSENFPVQKDEEWCVRDGLGRAVEKWRVIYAATGTFTVEVTELPRAAVFLVKGAA